MEVNEAKRVCVCVCVFIKCPQPTGWCRMRNQQRQRGCDGEKSLQRLTLPHPGESLPGSCCHGHQMKVCSADVRSSSAEPLHRVQCVSVKLKIGKQTNNLSGEFLCMKSQLLPSVARVLLPIFSCSPLLRC